jgi:hypothetical protein
MIPIYTVFYMTRRIKAKLKLFFENQNLTAEETKFILGCSKAQQNHPQLTGRQWEIICEIEKKYLDGKS